jgi:acyl-CoA thioesterase II
MRIERYPYRASARWEGQVVAQSDACLCVEEQGVSPVLYFPLADIDLDRFDDQGRRESTDGSKLQVWSIGPSAADPGATPDGRDILTSLVAPPAPLRELVGFGCFDQERVRIEITDGREGDAARDVTTKRLPLWGDAAHLIDVLDVRPDGPLSFVGVARSDGRRPVVEGSQMLGQAIVAAGRHATGRRVVSASMIFLRSADAREPLRFELAELSIGRTFSGLAVQVLQGGRCCAAGTVLLEVPSEDVIRHAADPPDVPGPYECDPYDMGVTGRDIRVVEGAYTDDPDAPAGPPVVDAWVRFREAPAESALNAGLLAQFSGHMSIAAALRPHPGVSQAQAHRTLSMGINAISLSLHREVCADEWLLYHHLSTFAGDGMTHAECRVHDIGGDLVASYTVEAMVRPFPAGTGTVDDRTAL